MLHTNECFWTFSAEERYWRTANIIECIFYFAVPVFFMISGITLMDFYDRNSLKEYFLKEPEKLLLIMRNLSARLREMNSKLADVCRTIYESENA